MHARFAALIAKGEGDGSVETVSRALPSSPSWNPEKGKCFFFLGFGYHCLGGQWRNRTKMKQKILHPALLRGKEWCSHHLLKSRIQRLLVARLRDAACLGASRAWQGRRRYPRCGRCEGCCCGRAGVEVEAAGGRPRRWADGGTAGPPGQDMTKRLRLLLLGTVGKSPPPLRRIGRPGRLGSPESDACRPPSYLPRSAKGGSPGPLMWTSSDPGPALWLSSPLGRCPNAPTHAPLGRMETEAVVGLRPQEPIVQPRAFRRRLEASSVAQRTQRPGKAVLDLTRATPIFLMKAAQPNHHLQNLARPLLVLQTRWWAPPCPRTLSARPGTPDGAMHWRSERPAETHSTGKLSLWSSSHPDHEPK